MVVALDIVILKNLVFSAEYGKAMWDFYISKVLNSSLNKWNNESAIGVLLVFPCKSHKMVSCFLAWFNNKLCATKWRFRFSKGMGLAQMRNHEPCTEKKDVWSGAIPCDSYRANTNPPVPVSLVSGKQTLRFRFQIINWKKVKLPLNIFCFFLCQFCNVIYSGIRKVHTQYLSLSALS